MWIVVIIAVVALVGGYLVISSRSEDASVVTVATQEPADEPTEEATAEPTEEATSTSTDAPSMEPSVEATAEPTDESSTGLEPVTGEQYEGLVTGTYIGGKITMTANPRCVQTGPCDVTGKVRGIKATFHFKYNKASHVYSSTAHWTRKCVGGVTFPLRAKSTVTFRVKSSEEVNGDWKATLLQISMKHASAPGSRVSGNTKYYCKADHWTSKGTIRAF